MSKDPADNELFLRTHPAGGLDGSGESVHLKEQVPNDQVYRRSGGKKNAKCFFRLLRLITHESDG